MAAIDQQPMDPRRRDLLSQLTFEIIKLVPDIERPNGHTILVEGILISPEEGVLQIMYSFVPTN